MHLVITISQFSLIQVQKINNKEIQLPLNIKHIFFFSLKPCSSVNQQKKSCQKLSHPSKAQNLWEQVNQVVKNVLINSPSTQEGSPGEGQKVAAPTNLLPPSTSTSQNKENNTVKLFSLQRESCSKEWEEEMLRTKASEQKF